MATEGQSGAQQIARLEKGDSTRTAMHADVMNEIIDAVNRMLALTVSPQGAGKFIWSDANGVLQIEASTGTGCGDEEPPDEGTFVCGSVDGVKQWIETTDCAAEGGIDGGSA